MRTKGEAERKQLPPPSFLLGLFQGLPPGSMVEAAANGSPGEVGWTVEAHLLASNSDWSQVGAISAGNWKKKAPDFKPVERPFGGGKKKKATKSASASVADWHRILEQNQARQHG